MRFFEYVFLLCLISNTLKGQYNSNTLPIKRSVINFSDLNTYMQTSIKDGFNNLYVNLYSKCIKNLYENKC